jgi:rRNA maturation protein Rpf1
MGVSFHGDKKAGRQQAQTMVHLVNQQQTTLALTVVNSEKAQPLNLLFSNFHPEYAQPVSLKM